MTTEFYTLLSALSAEFGPTGCECRVAALIENELSGLCDCSRDRMGSLICHLPGKGEKLLLVAHMDEAGFMVTDIDDKGYLRIAPTGNADPACFLGKHLTVGNETVLLKGIGGGKVLHLTSGAERTDSPSFDKLFIDLGFQNKEEAEKQIEKGDFAAYSGGLSELPNGYLAGKALESRSMCAIAAEVLKLAARKPVSERKDLTVVFAAKEKAGMSSAVTAAYRENAQKALLLGFSPSMDFDKTADHQKGARLGKGPVLAFKDGNVLFYDSLFLGELRQTAEKAALPFQMLNSPLTLSSGRAHLGKEGLPMASLQIPCFNPETPLVIVQKSDLCATLSLLSALV